MAIGAIQRTAAHSYKELWKLREHWDGLADLARKDPAEFIRQERDSGSAMWDDPPDGWGEEQLAIWSEGYAHGRAVETGNLWGTMRFLARALELWADRDYGPRETAPTPAQAREHRDRHICGAWIVVIRPAGSPLSMPHLVEIVAKPDEAPHGEERPAPEWLEVWDDGEYKRLEDAVEAGSEICSWMPVDMSGEPAPWPEGP